MCKNNVSFFARSAGSMWKLRLSRFSKMESELTISVAFKHSIWFMLQNILCVNFCKTQYTDDENKLDLSAFSAALLGRSMCR